MIQVQLQKTAADRSYNTVWQALHHRSEDQHHDCPSFGVPQAIVLFGTGMTYRVYTSKNYLPAITSYRTLMFAMSLQSRSVPYLP